ncbi:hypothetical protein ACN47E_003313 [Coniothyrium glycines]
MSGVEIAGLVLGCLPLIIQGIESYNEGLDPIKSFVRWERELPQFIRKLRNQHVHYAQTIRILLEPITSEVELAEMLSDPRTSQELWKSKNMVQKLQDKLQDSFQAYQSTISDIERIAIKIASKLDLDRAKELTRNDLEAIVVANPKKNDKFELKKRIRFGMNKKTIRALLEELDDCNKELERFTEKSERIETYRKTIKPSYAARLHRLQGFAKSLHSSLTLCWSCACKASHETSLQLQPRSELFASKAKRVNDTAKTSFNVSFTTTASGDNGMSWTWQAAEIRVDEESDDDTSLSPMPSPKPKMTKTVSFGSLPPYSVLDPSAPVRSLEEIKDLCASISQSYKKTPMIGFSLDNKNRLRGTYTVDSAEAHAPSPELVSLKELLGQSTAMHGKRTKLSKKERYSLALTLASSVLYLNSTPWLTDQWASEDIVFQRTNLGSRPIDFEHPYVVSKSVELLKPLTSTKARGFQNKNSVLLALAITLLELYFGTTADQYQESEHGTIDPSYHQNPWMLCSMAHEWAEDCQEDLSAAFLSAVRHCLRCFSDPGASLHDAEFLQAAVEGIVLPLQEELYQFLGKTVT